VLLLLVYSVFGVNYKGGVGYVNETKRDAHTEKLEFHCHITRFFFCCCFSIHGNSMWSKRKISDFVSLAIYHD
jgi:hypothetical protein